MAGAHCWCFWPLGTNNNKGVSDAGVRFEIGVGASQ